MNLVLSELLPNHTGKEQVDVMECLHGSLKNQIQTLVVSCLTQIHELYVHHAIILFCLRTDVPTNQGLRHCTESYSNLGKLLVHKMLHVVILIKNS